MINFQCLKYRFKYNYFIFNYPKCHFCHILSQKPRQKPQKPQKPRQKLPTAKNLPRPLRFRLDQKLSAPTKTPNRQKPFDAPPRCIICQNPVIPFSQFTSFLYIPHPIKKYKNKYPLAKILKKWTTWTTRLIINDICATFALHLPYILPKWTTLFRQKLHDTKRNHQTILS